MRPPIRKTPDPLYQLISAHSSRLRPQYAALKFQHVSGISWCAIHPRLAHAPQRRHDCVAHDEIGRIIDQLPPFALVEVRLMCATIRKDARFLMSILSP